MTSWTRKLSNSATQVVGTTAVILGTQAIGGIILARSLGPADRGLLAALSLWAATASDLAAVGSPSAVSYWAASTWPRNGLRILRPKLPWMAALSVGLFALFIAVSGRWDALPLIGVLAAGTWAAAQILYMPLQRFQQGLRNMPRFNGLRLIAEIGPTLGYILFALAGALTITTGFLSITAFVLAALGAALFLSRRVNVPRSPDPVTSDEHRRFWSYSGRSWLSILAGRSNGTIDLLMLTVLTVAAEDIGFYAVAITATSVIAVLGGSLGFDLFPRISAIGDDGDGRPLLRKFIGINALFSVSAAVVFFLVADWIIPLIYGDDFAGAIGPARILLIGVVATSISLVAGQGLAGMGYPGRQAIAQGVGAVVTLVGVLLAAGRSLEWVAGAAATGFVVTMVLMLWFTWRSAEVKYG